MILLLKIPPVDPSLWLDEDATVDTAAFWNFALPIVVLGVLALVVPWLLHKRQTRSQWEVAVTVWASAAVLMILSGITFAVLYAARGHGVGDYFTEAPVITLWFFISQAGYAAILWAPILGLVWFAMAQGVEKRKGEDAARR